MPDDRVALAVRQVREALRLLPEECWSNQPLPWTWGCAVHPAPGVAGDLWLTTAGGDSVLVTAEVLEALGPAAGTLHLMGNRAATVTLAPGPNAPSVGPVRNLLIRLGVARSSDSLHRQWAQVLVVRARELQAHPLVLCANRRPPRLPW